MDESVLMDRPYCDTHRHMCCRHAASLPQQKKLRNIILCGKILEEDATFVKFSDFFCSGLIERDRNNTTVVQHRVAGTDTILEIIEKDGDINLPVTEENKARGKLTGNALFAGNT
jgi:hypothetical protein